MWSNHTSNEVVLLMLFLNSFSLSQNKRFKPFCAGWRMLLESHSKLWQPYRRKKNTTWCALNNPSSREILTQKRASVGWESPFWGWQWILAESGWLCSSRFLSSSATASVVPPQTLHPKGREERRESRSACLDSHANMSVLCTSKKRSIWRQSGNHRPGSLLESRCSELQLPVSLISGHWTLSFNNSWRLTDILDM